MLWTVLYCQYWLRLKNNGFVQNFYSMFGPAPERHELPSWGLGPALLPPVTGGPGAPAPQKGPAPGCQRYVPDPKPPKKQQLTLSTEQHLSDLLVTILKLYKRRDGAFLQVPNRRRWVKCIQLGPDPRLCHLIQEVVSSLLFCCVNMTTVTHK